MVTKIEARSAILIFTLEVFDVSVNTLRFFGKRRSRFDSFGKGALPTFLPFPWT